MADTAGAAAAATSGQGGTAAPAGGTAPAGGNTPANSGPGGAFYDGIGNAELKTWVQGKNWSSIEAMAKSHHDLEGMIGAPANEIFRFPKEGLTPEMTRQLQTRLGLPEKADAYEINTGKDLGLPIDENFVGWARNTFHELGFTNAQVKALTTKWAELNKASIDQESRDYDLGVAADTKALQDEWKNGYDAQMGRGATAATQLGFTPEMVDAIESALGYGGTMRFFAGLASRLGEGNFVSGDSKGIGSAFGMNVTPAEAKAEWDKLSMDQGFAAALMNRTHPGHKAAVEKKSRLMSIIG